MTSIENAVPTLGEVTERIQLTPLLGTEFVPSDGEVRVIVENHLASPTSILTVTAPGGRELLCIGADGAVTGEIEDMGEAARIFVREVRALAEFHGLRLAEPAAIA